MKKFLLIGILAAMVSALSAQTVLFSDSEGNALGDTVNVETILDDRSTVGPHLFLANQTADTKQLAFTRNIIKYIDADGVSDEFCFGTSCVTLGINNQTYFVGDDNSYFPLNANAVMDLDMFFHVSNTNGVEGEIVLEYIAHTFEGAAWVAQDTVYGKFEFVLDAVNEKNASISNVYPNPTSGMLKVDYNFKGTANGQIVVRNIIGKMIEVYTVEGTQGTQSVDLSAYPTGMYFVNIENNGVVVDNKKLIKR
jgi:hypothetical protein